MRVMTYIMMDRDVTRYGAVETRDEGRAYAKWLKFHVGEYDGVILCMLIFVDKNAAIAAFPMTYSNCKTEDGKITIYFIVGEFTMII